MAQVRYAIVFGSKDGADRFLPIGEIYLRNTNLEEAKSLFKSLPDTQAEGEYIVRIYERYYDKHLDPDVNYEKTEFTIECSPAGLSKILDLLLNKFG